MNQSFITWIFRANIVLFALLLPTLFGLSPGEESRFFRFGFSALFLLIIFALPAINIAALFSKISGHTLDRVEFWSIAIAIAPIFVPFLLTIEADFFHILSPELPLINAAASFVLFALLFGLPKSTPSQATLPLALEQTKTFPFSRAFIAVFLTLGVTILGIITAYYPLPDLDPYYWIAIFQDQFTKGIISSITSYRPLFSSLSYLFNQSAGVDLYAFFKYLIPFFALIPLVPALLIARRFSGLVPQVLILLIPVVNASFFLYSTHPIPQSIFNSLLVTAVFFTLHSLLSVKRIYFFLAGGILFVGFFYHEMAAIPLFAWMASWLFFERKNIARFAKVNKLVTVLVLLLLFSNVSLLAPIFSFVSNWLMRIVTLMTAAQSNFAFPARYVNIDGNSVGWEGLAGVTQYYAYYFGPVALLILLSSPLILHTSASRALLRRKETVFLLLSLVVFLLMSDLLPRFFSIALLPERALGFASLFFLSFLPLLLLALRNQTNALHRLIPLGLLIAFLLNIGAALYINNLKQYLITPEQLTSAEWIRTNLPTNRVIFSADNRRLLTFYANSTVAGISDPQFYTDKGIVEQHLEAYAPKKTSRPSTIREELEKVAGILADLSNSQKLTDDDFLQNLRQESEQLDRIGMAVEEEIRAIRSTQGVQPKYYIYYAAPSAKNPYANRPYMPQSDVRSAPFIFDRYPERFRMIYSDTENDIYLWEVL